MHWSFRRHAEPIRRGAAVLAFVLAACGDDGTGPVDVDLAGEWDYVISDATGNGISFTTSVSDVTLTFTGSGDAIEGTVNAGGGDNIALTGSSGTTFRSLSGTSSIGNLTVDGAGIRFQFEDLSSAALSSQDPITSTGTIGPDGSSMSGTVTLVLRFGTSDGVVTRPVTGSWTATRL